MEYKREYGNISKMVIFKERIITESSKFIEIPRMILWYFYYKHLHL